MRVQIERGGRLGRRILLKCPWRTDVPEKCKAVDGASPLFDAAGKFKYWSYPLDFGTCRQLREVWGKDLEIGPELLAWAEVERDRMDMLDTILDASVWPVPRIEAQEPILAAAMRTRPFQSVAAAYAATARSCIIGDDPGLGKTLETFGAVVEAGITSGPILVFCPVSAVEATWMRNIWRFMPEDDVITCMGTRGQRTKAFAELHAASQTGRRTWFICNIEMTRVQFDAKCPGPTKHERALAQAQREEDKLDPPCDGDLAWCKYAKRHRIFTNTLWPELFEDEWQAIILDESHRALITTKSLRKKQPQKRVGFGMLKLSDGGLKIALSGTPWRGKAENFWGTLNYLRPDLYPGFWRWGNKYFDTDDNGFGVKIGQLKPEREDDWMRDLRSVMIRRTKREVAKDLPPKRYDGTPLIEGVKDSLWGVWLPMLPAQEKAYAQMTRDALAKLQGGTMYGNGVLAQMTRLRQFATSTGRMIPTGKVDEYGFPEMAFDPQLPSNKFDWLLDFLEERGIAKEDWGDSKVVVASQYTKVIELFRSALAAKGIRSHAITGRTKGSERLRQVDEFQAKGGPRVFFINTFAGGVSITLDAADDLVFIDETWIPDDQEQVEDRIHRVSRVHQVYIHYLRSLGTIEESIGLVTTSRDQMQKYLLDGMRGVEFAKKLITLGSAG